MPKDKDNEPVDLAKKYGDKLRKAFEAAKNEETEYGDIDLPPGLNGAIAQLTEIKFGVYQEGDMKGEAFFYAAGSVAKPVKFKGIKIKGRLTKIGPEPLCDTEDRSRKTMLEHVRWIANEIRKLGVATKDLKFDQLQLAVTALKKTKPYFLFRTWQGKPTEEYPNPRVNHVWQGAVAYDPEEDEEAQAARAEEQVDDTEPEEEDEDEEEGEAEEVVKAPPAKPAKTEQTPKTKTTTAPKTEPKPKAGSAGKPPAKPPGKTVKQPEPEPEPDEEEEQGAFDEFGDLDALVKKADEDDDDDAKDELKDIASKLGLDPDEVLDAQDWATVADMIRTAQVGKTKEEATEPDEAEEEPEPAPKEEERKPPPDKGDIVKVKLPGKKKPVDVTVTAVYKKTSTVDVQTLTDRVDHKKIPWSELLPS